MKDIVSPEVPNWEELEEGFKNIISSKKLTTDYWTKKCEEEIKKIHGCKYCLLTSSGTTAFMLLLSAVNRLYPHEKVRMQDYTFESTKQIAKVFCGNLDLEFVDVDIDTWMAEEPYPDGCLFIPTMTFGNVESYGWPDTIYDSTHCFGDKRCNGRGFGEIISFAPAKRITGGEGGAILTNDEDIYNEVKQLRHYHGRVPELSACLLYHNIKNHEKINPQTEVRMFDNLTDEKRQKLGKLFRIKQRYKPTSINSTNSWWLYNHMVMAPYGFDWSKVEEIVNGQEDK